MGESVTIVTLGISLLGLLASVALFQKRRKIIVELQKAVLNAPASNYSIREYLNNPGNAERLDAFYNASKFLKVMLYFVFGLGFFILVTLMMFHVSIHNSDAITDLEPVGGVIIEKSVALFSDGNQGSQFELPAGRTHWFVRIDSNGGIKKLAVAENRHTFLRSDGKGGITTSNIAELALSFLIFFFLISIITNIFLIGRMEDLLCRFEELDGSV